MNDVLRWLFFAAIVRPTVLLAMGLNLRHRERLPRKGPAVIVANHNSHLDACVLLSLFPLRMLPLLRPVAAQDYFFRNRFLKWFSLHIIGIIPLDRAASRAQGHPLAAVSDALRKDRIVVLFPEGSRGEPEQLGQFKAGAAHLAKLHPETPFIPVFMHGLGKALPRGEALFVPFVCDVFVGEWLHWTGDKGAFTETLTQRVNGLASEGAFPAWN